MTTETKALVGILVATILIIIGGAFFVAREPDSQSTVVTEPDRLVRADDPILGPVDAQVTVVEFGDFECPSCAALHPILKQIKDQNKDKSVRFVYRQFPLAQHPNAQLAAEASLAAQAQGKFWEYHDVMFENQDELERTHLEAYAAQVGLDVDAFKQALDDRTFRDEVDADRRDGTALKVSGTPTVFIDNVLFNGQYSVNGIQAAIDEALEGSNQ